MRETAISIAMFTHDWLCSQSSEFQVDVQIKQGPVGSSVPKEIAWVPSPNLWFKLNFDRSNMSTGKASFGFTICNDMGELRLSGAMAFSSDSSVLKADAWDFVKVSGRQGFLVFILLLLKVTIWLSLILSGIVGRLLGKSNL